MQSDIFPACLLLCLPMALSSCHVSQPVAAVVTKSPAAAPGSFGHLKELAANDDYEGLVEQYCGKSLFVKGGLDQQGSVMLTDRKRMAEALRLFFAEPDLRLDQPARNRKEELAEYNSFEDLPTVQWSGEERQFSDMSLTKNERGEVVILKFYLDVNEFDDLARFEPGKRSLR